MGDTAGARQDLAAAERLNRRRKGEENR